MEELTPGPGLNMLLYRKHRFIRVESRENVQILNLVQGYWPIVVYCGKDAHNATQQTKPVCKAAVSKVLRAIASSINQILMHLFKKSMQQHCCTTTQPKSYVPTSMGVKVKSAATALHIASC